MPGAQSPSLARESFHDYEILQILRVQQDSTNILPLYLRALYGYEAARADGSATESQLDLVSRVEPGPQVLGQ